MSENLDYCVIPLTRGYVAWVDREDYESLARHSWHVTVDKRSAYATRNAPRKKGRHVAMHREIMGPPPPGMEVDHICHPPGVVDNRRCNLRFVTRSQNNHNQRKFRGGSAFKGVSLHKHSGLWRATLQNRGQHLNVGYFKIEVHAALAYDLAAVRLRGEHALTNFPVPGSRNWIYG